MLMKICAISDLHGDLPTNLESCDVVCICGDISPLNIQKYTASMKSWIGEEFTEWIKSLDCSKVLLVPGNHDFLFERHPEFSEYINMSQNKLTILEDSQIEIDGKIFYGTPWCPDLIMWAYYSDHNTLIKKFNKIPNSVDVLLTHCPPRIGDCGKVLQDNVFNYSKDYGCEELKDAIEKKNPKNVLFGHVHSGSHEWITYNNSKLINVSLKDEKYNINYQPLYFDLM